MFSWEKREEGRSYRWGFREDGLVFKFQFHRCTCATLGKLPNFSDPQFLFENRHNNMWVLSWKNPAIVIITLSYYMTGYFPESCHTFMAGLLIKMIKWDSLSVASNLATTPRPLHGRWGGSAFKAVCRV